MAVLVENGTVVTAIGRTRADVRIEGGRIAAVGSGLRQMDDLVLDATGCYVLPGGVDVHTHIEMPAGNGEFNADTWYSGTVAAAWGGTTTVIDMITQEKGGSLAAALADWQRRAGPEAVIDYGFHMGITDPQAEVLAEIPAMVRAGVPSFKLYLAYKDRLMLSDGEALAVMQAIAREGGLALIHAENGEVIDVLVAGALARGETSPRYHAATRPPAVEAEAVSRACRLADLAGCALYIVHVTCREALAEVNRARRHGQTVHAETCTHYLAFTENDLDRPDFAGARWVLSPPLRHLFDQRAMLRSVVSGEVDVVASDHCPWTLAQKDRGRERFDLIPSGIPGVEERLPFLFTAGLPPERLVAVTATNPARLLGLYPRKGTIAPGSDADLVVWDPSPLRTWSRATHHSAADNTPYEGLLFKGAARHVLVRGRPVIADGTCVAAPGSGQFLPRTLHAK